MGHILIGRCRVPPRKGRLRRPESGYCVDQLWHMSVAWKSKLVQYKAARTPGEGYVKT
jgi:hypothetical protein